MGTAQAELSKELYAYLVNHEYSVPQPKRSQNVWVMNDEWWDECKRIPGYEMAHCFIMLGRPVVITPDGGVPHLERRLA